MTDILIRKRENIERYTQRRPCDNRVRSQSDAATSQGKECSKAIKR